MPWKFTNNIMSGDHSLKSAPYSRYKWVVVIWFDARKPHTRPGNQFNTAPDIRMQLSASSIKPNTKHSHEKKYL